MAIYVDNLIDYTPIPKLADVLWCHLACDNLDDLTELHEFSQKIGLTREWFHDRPTHPHYDLSPYYRQRALEAGAIPISAVDLVRRCTRFLQPR